MNYRKEPVLLKDGRNAERHLSDWETTRPIKSQTFDGIVQEDQCGVQERMMELHVEKPREKHLAQRVVERRKPIVYERETQQVDIDTGEIVEKRIEALGEENSRMKLVDHIGVSRPEKVNNQYVTHDDLNSALNGLTDDLKSFLTEKDKAPSRPEPTRPEPVDEVYKNYDDDNYDDDYDYDYQDNDELYRLQGDTEKSSDGVSFFRIGMIGLIVIEMVALVYILTL